MNYRRTSIIKIVIVYLILFSLLLNLTSKVNAGFQNNSIGTAGSLVKLNLKSHYERIQAILYQSNGDLHARVVGTRLAIKDIDPYFFQWRPDMPEEWRDPHVDPKATVTRLTVPPTTLLLHLPLVSLSHQTQVIIWLIVEWLCYLGIGLMLYDLAGSKTTKPSVSHSPSSWSVAIGSLRNRIGLKSCNHTPCLIIIGLSIFAISFHWWNHLAVGQVYILYSLFITLGFWIHNKHHHTSYLSYLLWGMTAAFRFPYLLLILLVLMRKKIKPAIYFILGLTIPVIASLIIFNPNLWTSYAKSVLFISDNKFDYGIRPDAIFNKITDLSSSQMTASDINPFLVYDTSIKIFADNWLNLPISNQILYVSFAIVLIGCLGYFYKIGLWHKNFNSQFLAMIVLVLISEFFIPVPRHAYYDVQWLLPWGILVILYKKSRLKQLILLLGLILVSNLPYLHLQTGMLLNWVWIMLMLILMFLYNQSRKQFSLDTTNSISNEST